jgi:hypothetical protein
MLSPLGVLPDDLEEVFLIQLDNTGKLRGRWYTNQAESPFATFATPSQVSSKISTTFYPK